MNGSSSLYGDLLPSFITSEMFTYMLHCDIRVDLTSWSQNYAMIKSCATLSSYLVHICDEFAKPKFQIVGFILMLQYFTIMGIKTCFVILYNRCRLAFSVLRMVEISRTFFAASWRTEHHEWKIGLHIHVTSPYTSVQQSYEHLPSQSIPTSFCHEQGLHVIAQAQTSKSCYIWKLYITTYTRELSRGNVVLWLPHRSTSTNICKISRCANPNVYLNSQHRLLWWTNLSQESFDKITCL